MDKTSSGAINVGKMYSDLLYSVNGRVNDMVSSRLAPYMGNKYKIPIRGH